MTKTKVAPFYLGHGVVFSDEKTLWKFEGYHPSETILPTPSKSSKTV